tara:strand:- start:326 stop:526 length:201 start_codon:yes stop_codon:yes gene_type:complete
MALDNAVVLENLRQQKAELEQQFEAGREMYLKIQGAIDVLEQIEGVDQQETIAEAEIEAETEVGEE